MNSKASPIKSSSLTAALPQFRRASTRTAATRQARLEEIQNIIAKRNANETQYDDSIVRQMIECIKVHNDGKLTIIFGGGYEIEETL